MITRPKALPTLCFRYEFKGWRKVGNMNKTYNKYILSDEYALLRISKDKCTIFDREDYERVSKHRWHISGSQNQYVYTHLNGKHTSLQRFLLNCPSDLVVDHINRDTFDNRKENLRICTQKENTHNRREGRGIHRFRNKWRADIGIDGKKKHLGTFATYEEALKARKEAEKLYY